MPALGKEPASVTHFIRNLQGSSHPFLAKASDGRLYVVKVMSNDSDANILFNESMGSELYRAFGLAVPSWKPLLVSDSFLDHHQNCWTVPREDRVRARSALSFGSRFLGGDGQSVFEILPGTRFKRVRNRRNFWLAWVIDICACHSDNRQAIFREQPDGTLEGFFIDHGHLFGGPKGEQRPHFMASRYLDKRIYQAVCSGEIFDFQRAAKSFNADRLWKRVEALPDEWKTASALSALAQCLDRLSCTKLLQNILELMVQTFAPGTGPGPTKNGNEQEYPVSVLCLGIPTSGVGADLVRRHAGHCVCG